MVKWSAFQAEYMGSIPITRKMVFNSIDYFHKMKQFFVRKGKKETVEKLFYRFLLNRAKAKKKSMVSILHNCIMNGTPFLRLKSRRRGK